MNRTMIHSNITISKEIRINSGSKTSKVHLIANEHKNKHSKMLLHNHDIRCMILNHLILLWISDQDREFYYKIINSFCYLSLLLEWTALVYVSLLKEMTPLINYVFWIMRTSIVYVGEKVKLFGFVVTYLMIN